MKSLTVISMIAMTIVFQGKLYACRENSHRDTVPLLVKKCSDFILTGDGKAAEWTTTGWNNLTRLDTLGGRTYSSRFKILYSGKGIYVLFTGEDEKISTRYDQDFGDLYRGDVFEVFFHTDRALPLYFEYEINPLEKELVLLIPNINGRFYGWVPFHYEKERTTKKIVSVTGGKKAANSSISSWTAELFFPYELFRPLGNVPPPSGATWYANFYRLDHDRTGTMRWAWAPVQKSFHEPSNFRPIRFE
jgi:hypothetical protein